VITQPGQETTHLSIAYAAVERAAAGTGKSFVNFRLCCRSSVSDDLLAVTCKTRLCHLVLLLITTAAKSVTHMPRICLFAFYASVVLFTPPSAFQQFRWVVIGMSGCHKFRPVFGQMAASAQSFQVAQTVVRLLFTATFSVFMVNSQFILTATFDTTVIISTKYDFSFSVEMHFFAINFMLQQILFVIIKPPLLAICGQVFGFCFAVFLKITTMAQTFAHMLLVCFSAINTLSMFSTPH